jgi:hypothetical protein
MPPTTRHLNLSLVAGDFAVAQLPGDPPIPAWAAGAEFFSITHTADELSIVAPAGNIPAGVRAQKDWRILKLHGPFAFSETGILSSLLAPLAAANVAIFALSTFDTDYLLVSATQLSVAIAALEASGHRIQQTEFSSQQIPRRTTE